MKPSIPKGTRDFSPQEMVKRNYIFDTIRKVYQSYGYQPIETPAFENSETLMGKYGEEGDRLIFKILNSGNYIDDLPPGFPMPSKFEDNRQFTRLISEKALRYDLTVPFARYVVQHRNDITFPFKRYQIQPVWRADRPQKGRYREFYQCDADVIGSDSLLNEVELIQIIDEVFTKLGVPVIIKINNRKILQGIAELIDAPDRMIDIAVAIDKIDKIGIEGVMEELKEKKFTTVQINFFRSLLTEEGKLNFFTAYSSLGFNQKLQVGIDEVEKIFSTINKSKINKVEFELSLARGLNYYTGTIIEVKADPSKSTFTSSICGGGRYDDLTGIFGLPDVSGVGISFGADRIYDVIEELGLFPKEIEATTKVLVLNNSEKLITQCLHLVKLLHDEKISAQFYPDDFNPKKGGKQIDYASKMGIPFVVSINEDQLIDKPYKVKRVDGQGQWQTVSLDELISMIK
ncbi:MAG TPA: histidine--tRNA ligase [Bacteroidia bacterium]|nr:histidine--tRNA ligase [Bacteroidia bacterium]